MHLRTLSLSRPWQGQATIIRALRKNTATKSALVSRHSKGSTRRGFPTATCHDGRVPSGSTAPPSIAVRPQASLHPPIELVEESPDVVALNSLCLEQCQAELGTQKGASPLRRRAHERAVAYRTTGSVTPVFPYQNSTRTPKRATRANNSVRGSPSDGP